MIRFLNNYTGTQKVSLGLSGPNSLSPSNKGFELKSNKVTVLFWKVGKKQDINDFITLSLSLLGRKYAHSGILLPNDTFIDFSWSGVGIFFEDTEQTLSKDNVVAVELDIDANEVFERARNCFLKGPDYDTKEYIQFLLNPEKGYLPAKKHQALTCSTFTAYCLGLKDYWKYNTDKLYEELTSKNKTQSRLSYLFK